MFCSNKILFFQNRKVENPNQIQKNVLYLKNMGKIFKCQWKSSNFKIDQSERFSKKACLIYLTNLFHAFRSHSILLYRYHCSGGLLLEKFTSTISLSVINFTKLVSFHDLIFDTLKVWQNSLALEVLRLVYQSVLNSTVR